MCQHLAPQVFQRSAHPFSPPKPARGGRCRPPTGCPGFRGTKLASQKGWQKSRLKPQESLVPPKKRGLELYYAGFRDLQIPSFEIPWFLGKIEFWFGIHLEVPNWNARYRLKFFGRCFKPCPFHPLVGGHDSPLKGSQIIIPKRA